MLLDSHCEKPEMVRRFVEEAQIGGQLQHPGVVPVYELGSFVDRRPFFTMKLVKGRTLAELIRCRSGLGDDLPRFLSIFESICQTMAYAHARGVIHRDLKPANVMVGSFGEVQVMDWGLAKVLHADGESEENRAKEQDLRRTVIATARSDSGADVSQAGSVLGTPAYMAPEQARGETEAVDERADVFGAGGDTLRDPHRPTGVRRPGRERDPVQGDARRSGRGVRDARGLRRRARADRPGPGLPGAGLP